MSIEHMRSRGTLARNIQMSLAADLGDSLNSIARRHGNLQISSVRSSVMRTRGHVGRFVECFPDVISKDQSITSAYKAFAVHVGVQLDIRGLKRKGVQQMPLF